MPPEVAPLKAAAQVLRHFILQAGAICRGKFRIDQAFGISNQPWFPKRPYIRFVAGQRRFFHLPRRDTSHFSRPTLAQRSECR